MINLRLLCPNCHAQTPTYRAKNINNGIRKPKQLKPKPRQTDKLCLQCGNSTKNIKYKYCSQECSKLASRTVERPSREELLQMVKDTSYITVARKYKVSDNAIRKWLK